MEVSSFLSHKLTRFGDFGFAIFLLSLVCLYKMGIIRATGLTAKLPMAVLCVKGQGQKHCERHARAKGRADRRHVTHGNTTHPRQLVGLCRERHHPGFGMSGGVQQSTNLSEKPRLLMKSLHCVLMFILSWFAP